MYEYFYDIIAHNMLRFESPDLVLSSLSSSSLPRAPPKDIDDFCEAGQSTKQAILSNVTSLETSTPSHFPDCSVPISGATSGTVAGPSDNSSSITDAQFLGTPSDNSPLESARNGDTSNPATFPKKPKVPLNASGKGKTDKQCAVQDGRINAEIVPIVGTFSGSCLQFPGELQHQPTLAIEAAVNLLLQGDRASYQMPYSWGYIDKPASAFFPPFIPPAVTL